MTGFKPVICYFFHLSKQLIMILGVNKKYILSPKLIFCPKHVIVDL